eukprot:TRINITY_DN49505_c0_g1_i2.p1 TRINITY_DN49505_c0_g1~~TRINITY_DN49505_c0_g1_i2.p1  ORF type:complete len:113 (-),score=22.84 TRINITY_DN49505_c0_g1_i2:364-702(-)
MCIRDSADGRAVVNPFPDLQENESTSRPNALSNTRGTLAVAHWDVPDCGNSEFFINLQDNLHLNPPTYGGYTCFAFVPEEDSASWSVITAIAEAIAGGGDGTRILIESMALA